MKIHEDIVIFYKQQPVYNIQYTFSTPYVRWNKQTAIDKQTNYNNYNETVTTNDDGKRLPTTVLQFNRVERPIHPTQKPVELAEWIIKTYSNEGDIILDSTSGSGTIPIACINTNRNWIAFVSNTSTICKLFSTSI